MNTLTQMLMVLLVALFPPTAEAEKKALLIEVTKYEHARMNSSALTHPEDDTKRMQRRDPFQGRHLLCRLHQDAELITNSVGMKLKLIPAGEFLMGSPTDEKDRGDDEGPQQMVRITQPYYMGVTEVTQGQWVAVMGTKPWEGKDYVQKGDNYPAVHVSWDDAVEYSEKLSTKEGKVYRLPTEAEWEYACRGGKAESYNFGSDIGKLKDYAWFDVTANDVGQDYAHEVGTKKPNPFGLSDMHGNVWEWCSNWYGPYDSTAAAAGPLKGSYRVYRGGCWSNSARLCRSASRFNFGPSYRNYDLGFRLALSPSGQ